MRPYHIVGGLVTWNSISCRVIPGEKCAVCQTDRETYTHPLDAFPQEIFGTHPKIVDSVTDGGYGMRSMKTLASEPSLTSAPVDLEILFELIETVLFTSSVRDLVPISILLVADSGTAKSKIIKAFQGDNLHKTDSVSSQGLSELVQQDPKNEKSYILLPDLNPTLSRQPKTVNALVANLLTLLMDGTCRVDDGRQQKTMHHRPMGLISAVTPDIYHGQRKKWFSLGLTRRIIPLFYEYSPQTLRKVLDSVAEDKTTSSDFPLRSIELGRKCSPRIGAAHAKVIESFGVALSANLGLERTKSKEGAPSYRVKKIVPISPTIVLRTVAQASAIRNGRYEQVTEEDLTFLARFLEFSNPLSPRQI
jgi:hypothetical protein